MKQKQALTRESPELLSCECSWFRSQYKLLCTISLTAPVLLKEKMARRENGISQDNRAYRGILRQEGQGNTEDIFSSKTSCFPCLKLQLEPLKPVIHYEAKYNSLF